jgi:putative Mn2+ efflux pump MntP
MELITLLLVAFGLAMDSVTVSISYGLLIDKFINKIAFRIAFFMGLFQAVMPVIGWFLGNSFKIYIESVDHWIAFFILLFLGGRMIYEELSPNNDFKCFDPYSFKTLTGLAIATSIDAMAVGITFGMISFSLITSITVIGVVSFILSYLAVYLANKFKQRIKFPFELVGGIILIIIGIKILIEHLTY